MNKKSIRDLAIFGGEPAFSDLVHVGRPNIANRKKFVSRIKSILDSRCLSNNGPFVREFEEKLQTLTGARHCLAVCNATVGLQIAARSLGLSGEVIIPSFTFIATAHALQWINIKPIFCDIDSKTHLIDVRKISEMINPHTSGLLGVHLWGRACDIDELTKIANQYQLPLLFDAAQAFGCTYGGQPLGNFGDAEVFSFHATKVVNTFEGGVITTNDDQLAEKVRLARNFGFQGNDQTVDLGINAKMSEISAAMGLTELESLDDFISINYSNYQHYREWLKDVQGIKVIDYPEFEKSNYHYIIIEIDEETTGIGRDEILKILHAENILARRYFYPGCHQMEPYRSRLDKPTAILPETERLAKRVLSLPNGSVINERDVMNICKIIRFIVEHGVSIKQTLEAQDAQARSFRSTAA